MKSQLVISMKLDQLPDGTATLKVGPKYLDTKTRGNVVVNTYDQVLSMAHSIKQMFVSLGFAVAAEDRFTARVLSVPYAGETNCNKAA